MNKNQLIWGFVAITCLITIAISFQPMNGQKQQATAPGQEHKGAEDDLKYPVVQFNEPEPQDANEREKKRRKNSRFDRKKVVRSRVHPNTSGISIGEGDEGILEKIQSLAPIPVTESDLIFIGTVTSAKASLSNDKTGIYSEYQVSVIEVLKNDSSGNLKPRMMVDVDRAGGIIIYPNGQKVIYFDTKKNLPRVGSDYVFFVRKDDVSPNYEILTGYEFFNNLVFPLDYIGNFRKYKGYNPMNFIDLIRRTIQSPQSNNQGE